MEILVPRLGRSVPTSVAIGAIHKSVQALGYSAPTQEQEEVIFNFISGRDLFVSLPTGSGKSLCYACLPLVFDELKLESESSIVIVLSPLNSLMKDQEKKFSCRGLETMFLSRSFESTSVQEKLLRGAVQLIYSSPEVILTVPFWRDILRSPCYQRNLVGLAVDEAHLVEKW